MPPGFKTGSLLALLAQPRSALDLGIRTANAVFPRIRSVLLAIDRKLWVVFLVLSVTLAVVGADSWATAETRHGLRLTTFEASCQDAVLSGEAAYSRAVFVACEALPVRHRVDVAFALRLLLVSLLCAMPAITHLPLLRRLSSGAAPAVRWGWSIAGSGWIVYAALLSLLGIAGDVLIEVLRLLPVAILAGSCAAYGGYLGDPERGDSILAKRLPRMLAVGFVALATVNVLTAPGVDAAVNEIALVLHTGVKLEVDEADFWLSSAPGQTQFLDRFLESSPWLVLGYGYVVATRSRHDLLTFLRGDPPHTPGVGRAADYVRTHASVLHAWLLVVVALWLLVAGITADQTIVHAWGAKTHADAEPAIGATRRLLAIAPAYALLLASAIATARRLVARHRDGQAVGTNQRDCLLARAWPSLWLLFFVASLEAVNLYTASRALGAPAAIGVERVFSAPSTAPPVGVESSSFVGMVAVAFLAAAAHFLALVEFPYWRGQVGWKADEVARTKRELSTAEGDLNARLSEAASDVGAATSPDQDKVARLLARYTLALEHARGARDTRVHSFDGAADLARKAAGNLATSIVAAVAGLQGIAPPVQSFLKVLVDWAASRPF